MTEVPVDFTEVPAGEAPQTLGEKMERYRKLRANVRRRRTFYVLFILLTIGVLALTIVDILYLDSQLKWIGVFPAYGLLFILAIILLFSRSVHEEELAEMRALERSLLECPDCKNVFRFGSLHWSELKAASFSCPVCGVYSQLPGPDTPPVEAYIPAGEVRDLAYKCDNCNEQFSIGTYVGTPLHEVSFRTCPKCQQKGHIQRMGATPA